MKKIIFLVGIVLLLLSGVCFAQDVQWNVANQSTIGWQPVTTLDTGDPLPEGSSISYEVFLIKENDSRDNLLPVATEASLQHTFTFTEEGKYLAGIRAVRIINESGFTVPGDISWSDDVLVVEEAPFGFAYYIAPAKATGLSQSH